MATAVDVLVVGAGPTGMMLAGELLRRGLSVRVIDRASAPATLSKAVGVHARTLEILDELGVADDLVARGLPIRGIAMWAGAERVVDLDFSAPASMSCCGAIASRRGSSRRAHRRRAARAW